MEAPEMGGVVIDLPGSPERREASGGEADFEQLRREAEATAAASDRPETAPADPPEGGWGAPSADPAEGVPTEAAEAPKGPAVGILEIGEAPPWDHFYLTAPPPTGKSSKRLLRRAASEWKQLHEGLPEQITAQVFDERMDLLRVIIEGPPDTPYQSAVFVFDIHLQAGYPDVPPRVTYWAWGRRINPNLYANGKVCLSLLGTWAGPSWEPQLSTLLQVLVSIQAMILIETPYCNEPGQQGDAGTQKSLDYNKQVQVDVVHSMTMMASKPPVGCEEVVAAFMERDARNFVRMARELPNDFITVEALVALDIALKHPLDEPVTGKAAKDEEGLMEAPDWIKLATPPEDEGGEAAGLASGINADEEKESCATVCLAVSCSLILLLLFCGATYFLLQLVLWCVWQFYGMDCMLEPLPLTVGAGPVFPASSIMAATRENDAEGCCASCQLIAGCKSSMYLPEDNTAALHGWLNGTAWAGGVADAGLGTFENGPETNRISCFLTQLPLAHVYAAGLKPVPVPKAAVNTTWKTVATVCDRGAPAFPLIVGDGNSVPAPPSGHGWSMAFISLLPLCLRAVALCMSLLSDAPGVQGIVLAVRAFALGATSSAMLGHVASSRGLTESLSGGEEEMDRGSSSEGLIRAPGGMTAEPASSTEAAGQTDGRYVAQRAVAAVEIAEAATESAAEAAARAEWGALTGVGFGQMGYMGMEYSRPQSSWDAARHGLGLTVWEGKALSAERMILWYWMQPIVFLWVLGQNFCGLSVELRWQVAIVGLREVTFFLATGLAALPCACPGFLLLDSRLIRPSQWQKRSKKKQPKQPQQHDELEIDAAMNGDAPAAAITDGAADGTAVPETVPEAAEVVVDGGGGDDEDDDDYDDDAPYRPGRDPGSQIVRAAVYLLAPHHFVTLCLVRRFGTTWGSVAVMHLLADYHSLTALWLLMGEPDPSGALAVGFVLTVPVLFAWFGVVAWRFIEGTIEIVPERPPAGRVCVGMTGCLMVCAALSVLALGVTALLGFGGALSPGDGVCYSALRGDACVQTGELLAGGSFLPERFGYTCVGSSCAAQPALGSLLSTVPCAFAAPEGYTLDAKSAQCVAP